MNEITFLTIADATRYISNDTSILDLVPESHYDAVIERHVKKMKTRNGKIYFVLTLDLNYRKIVPGVFLRIDQFKKVVDNEFN